jgi:hypothetical protein
MIIIKFIKWMPWFRSEEDDAIITEIFFLSVFVILLAGFTATPHFFSSITGGFSIGLIGVMERVKTLDEPKKNACDSSSSFDV